jgi:hypothetical protein
MALLAYQVHCPNSGQTVLAGCACEDAGHDAAAAGRHHDRCQMASLTANLACAGSAECCGSVGEDHDCEAISNACPGGHGDCPVPDDCALHESVKAHYKQMAAGLGQHKANVAAGLAEDVPHFAEAAQEPPEQCPGGHCHKLIEDCAVHHPVTIIAGQGTAYLRPVAQAAS